MAVSKNFMDWAYGMERTFRRDKVSFIKFDNPKERKTGFVAVDERTGKTAKSFCNPSDLYNPYIGRAIAYARLRGLIIPPLESYKIRECVGKYIKFKDIVYYVTPVTIPFGGELDYFCMALPKKGLPYIAQISENREVELIK